MANYVQVQYDPFTSPHGTVQACLQFKLTAATTGSDDKIAGIGSQSCFSAVLAVIRDAPVLILGNSRNKVPFAAQRLACVHGECNAMWEALHENGDQGIPAVLEMYIEMHPCPSCLHFLENALPPAQVVYYSFPYTPQGREAWAVAAEQLCRLQNL